VLPRVVGSNYGEGDDDPFAIETTGLFGEHVDRSPLKVDRTSIGHVPEEEEGSDMKNGAGGAGSKSSLSNIDIHLFDSQGSSSQYEENGNAPALDAHSRAQQLQQLYGSLSSTHKHLEQSLQRLNQIADTVHADLQQAHNEQAVAAHSLLGPPRRLPIPADVQSTHARKQKVKALERHLKEIEHTMTVVSDRRGICESQLLAVARELAVAKEHRRHWEEQLNDVNAGLGQLPVVIGTTLRVCLYCSGCFDPEQCVI
jgi:hypothetical protein